MNFYQLFDYSSSEWFENISKQLNETNLTSLNDIKSLIVNLANFSDDIEFKTFDILNKNYTETELLFIFNKIKHYALKLPILFRSGKIPRLNETITKVELKRLDILCLLCHMTLCTLKKTRKNFYWVTFENWLTDGRTCAIAYLHTLIEYFNQTFLIQNLESNEFMNETIVFRRNKANLTDLISILETNECKLRKVKVLLNGSIGDGTYPEVDFANCDIGFGITGTQEEILFGSSPELCVAMLFCDTLNENEAISITGARKVAYFNGYGIDVSLKSFVPFEKSNQIWKNRIIIAMDALDFSDKFENSLKKQILTQFLNRELVKAYAGFSLVEYTPIQTGHWGCGAFAGNKQLKSLIQLVAASLAKNDLIFYCRGSNEFYNEFKNLISCIQHESVSTIWKLILNIQNDIINLKNENIFAYIKENINKN
jgi:poly(ADP-ribose) glycohydrolase